MTNHIEAMTKKFYKTTAKTLGGRCEWEDLPLPMLEMNFDHMRAAVEALPPFIRDLILNNATEPEPEGDLYDRLLALRAEIEALPKGEKPRKGDIVADPRGKASLSVWECEMSSQHAWLDARIIRRAPRAWKIGDLVDTTEGLPGGTVIRDYVRFVGQWDGHKFRIAGQAYEQGLDFFTDPRIIWLPETEDES